MPRFTPVAFYSLLALLLLCSSIATAAAPPSEYVVSMGSTAVDHSYRATTDDLDNLIVVGFVGGTVDMGGGPLVSIGLGALTLAKYDANGGHLWSFVMSAAAGNYLPQGLETDSAGNIYLTGRMTGTVDFGGGPLVVNDNGDIFLAKFSPAGTHLWSQQFGGTGLDQALDLDADDAGNVVITGRFFGTIDFGGGTLTSVGTNGIYLARFDTDGVHQWSQQFSNGSWPYAQSVAFDGVGDIIMGGRLTNLDFGGGPLTSTGTYDSFLAKFDGNGNHLWSKLFNGTLTSQISFLVIDSGNNILIGGLFDGTYTLDAIPLTSLGGQDSYVARCDPNGNVQWAHALGGTWSEHLRDIQVGPNDDLIVGGNFYLDIQIGGSTALAGDPTSTDFFVVNYAATGLHQWSMVLGGSGGGETYLTLATDSAGAFYTFGEYPGSTVIDGVTLTSLGSSDLFVAKFFDPQVVGVVLHSFAAIAGADGVDLAWSFNDVSSLVSYRILRREDSGSEQVIFSGPVLGSPTFRDTTVKAGHSYTYELSLMMTSGHEMRSQISTVTIPRVAVSLHQNSPNPFNPRTTIRYSLNDPSHVVIEIFDVAGALVRRLDAGNVGSGSHKIEWDGTDNNGQSVSSGGYYYRLAGTTPISSRKMTLLK